jgi:hypothetical protein
VDRHGLRAIPHHRWTFVADRGIARELGDGRHVLRPGTADATMSDLDHLLFALRYDGLNLELCAAFFAVSTRADLESALTQRLRDKPTGKYLRRLWFVYEWLTERSLDVPDLTQGTYVVELPSELDFLVGLRRTREAMLQVVDLPDRLADLFVKLCLQNGGHVSVTKRKSQFAMLSDPEIDALEKCVQENMPERRVSRA